MHPEIHDLYLLHQVDAHILTLDRTLKKLDNGDMARSALAAAQRELALQEDALKKARVALADAEVSLKANEVKQAAGQKRLLSASNERQAEAAQHELDALKATAGALETTILETMDAIEGGEGALAAQKEEVAHREEVLATVTADYAKQSASIKQQMQAAVTERAGMTGTVSAPVLARYESARKRTKDTGMAALELTICGGCRMPVPGISINALNSSQDLVACDNCGRLLVRPL